MEILYKDFPIEQARQAFNEIKQIPMVTEPGPKKRKIRIPANDK